MPYKFAIYNFQDDARAAASHAGIAALEADGWKIHTASIGYTEMSALWHKPQPEIISEPEKDPEDSAAAPESPDPLR